MQDEFALGLHQIAVYQIAGMLDAYVQSTVYHDRVPEGACLQWVFGEQEVDPDPRPDTQHFECACIYHQSGLYDVDKRTRQRECFIKPHTSKWVHHNDFKRDARKRNGVESSCRDCRNGMVNWGHNASQQQST